MVSLGCKQRQARSNGGWRARRAASAQLLRARRLAGAPRGAACPLVFAPTCRAHAMLPQIAPPGTIRCDKEKEEFANYYKHLQVRCRGSVGHEGRGLPVGHALRGAPWPGGGAAAVPGLPPSELQAPHRAVLQRPLPPPGVAHWLHLLALPLSPASPPAQSTWNEQTGRHDLRPKGDGSAAQDERQQQEWRSGG
jgi:hypothetical protein